MTDEFLIDFISKNKYAVLSTVSKKRKPQAALVGIAVTPDLRLIFDTVSSTRKYQNLISNPAIAFVIGCSGEQTLQLEGIAKLPAADDLDDLLETYFKVFPDGRERREKCKDIVYFVVEPDWVRFLDFSDPNFVIEDGMIIESRPEGE